MTVGQALALYENKIAPVKVSVQNTKCTTTAVS